MGLHQIRYFLAVCETLNFTKAAQRCHVTQPSLTRAIQNLEDELGDKLFERARSGTTLTAFGRAMRRELEPVQVHVKAARETAQCWAKGIRGRLRVGVCHAAGSTGISRFLGAFQSTHDGISLRVVDAPTDELRLRLARAEIDAAMLALPQALDSSPHVIHLYDESLVVVMPAGHRLTSRDTVSLAELMGEPILLGVHNVFSDALFEALRAASDEVSLSCYCTRDDWLVGMVVEGAGIAIVPEGLCLPAALTTRSLSGPIVRQAIHLHLCTSASSNRVLYRMREFAQSYPLDSRDRPWACASE